MSQSLSQNPVVFQKAISHIFTNNSSQMMLIAVEIGIAINVVSDLKPH